MKREIIFSLILHLVVFALVVFSAPFNSAARFEPGEVIRIRAVSMPDFSPPSAEPVAIAPPVVPQALPEDVPEIPISDPATVTEPKEVEKPKPKPKKPANQTQPAQADTGGSGSNGKTEIDVSGSGPGSPFAGATIDNASFDYPYWFTQTFNKLAANFRNTVVIDGRVVCVVYFQVLRSGRMVDLKVEQTSGIPAFDKVCLTAVEKSAPFPPLPKDFRDEIIGISVPFTNSSR